MLVVRVYYGERDVAVAKKQPLCYTYCNKCSSRFRRRTCAKDPGKTIPQLPHPLARESPGGCAALARCLARGHQCHCGCFMVSVGRIWDTRQSLCIPTGHRLDRLQCSARRPSMALRGRASWQNSEKSGPTQTAVCSHLAPPLGWDDRAENGKVTCGKKSLP